MNKFDILKQPIYDSEIYKWWESIDKKSPISYKEGRYGYSAVTLKYPELRDILDNGYIKRRIKTFASLSNKQLSSQSPNMNENSNTTNKKKKENENKIINEKNDIILKDKIINELKIQNNIKEEIVKTNDMIKQKEQNRIKDMTKELDSIKLLYQQKQNYRKLLTGLNGMKVEYEQLRLKTKEIEKKYEFHRMCTKFEQVMLDYGKYHNYDGCEDECCNKEYIPKTPWRHFRYHCFDLVEFYSMLMGVKVEVEWDEFVEIYDSFLVFRDKMLNEYMFYESLDINLKKKYREQFYRISLRVYQIMVKHVEHIALRCSCESLYENEDKNNFVCHIVDRTNPCSEVRYIRKGKVDYHNYFHHTDDIIKSYKITIEKIELVKGPMYDFLTKKIKEAKSCQSINP